MAKPIKTATLPKKPGVYVATKRLLAYKGLLRDDKPVVVRCAIPKGAVIVVPIQKYEPKFRVSRFSIIDRGKFESPVKRYSYVGGRAYSLRRIDRNIQLDCAKGFHLCWTQRQARYWANYQ